MNIEHLWAAWKNLLADSPIAQDALDRATVGDYPIALELGKIPGFELARTYITPKSARITIDLDKVQEYVESVEAILAHEICHIKYSQQLGFNEFFNMLVRDKPLNCFAKELDGMALKEELLVRQELINSGRPRYKRCFPYRGSCSHRSTVCNRRA